MVRVWTSYLPLPAMNAAARRNYLRFAASAPPTFNDLPYGIQPMWRRRERAKLSLSFPPDHQRTGTGRPREARALDTGEPAHA